MIDFVLHLFFLSWQAKDKTHFLAENWSTETIS